MTIGQSIRKHRLENDMTLAELGYQLGIMPETANGVICSWEHGRRDPSWHYIARLVKVFGLNVITDVTDTMEG